MGCQLSYAYCQGISYPSPFILGLFLLRERFAFLSGREAGANANGLANFTGRSLAEAMDP
jgi:hypothetical protein